MRHWPVLIVVLGILQGGLWAQNANPFGVQPGGKTIPQRIALAKELGVRYYRLQSALALGGWDGRNAEAEAVKAAGLELVLSVRNATSQGEPGGPVQDFGAFEKTLGEVLDILKPALLVVENEQNSKLFYTGTAEEYLAELTSAAKIARARGTKCTDGGMVSSLVALLVADEYRQKGEADRADAYLAKAVGEERLAMAQRQPKRLQEQVEKGWKLLKGYKAAGADYVNFHWYIRDADALREAVAFLGRHSGLPVVCNEMGQQRNEDPEQVRTMVQTAMELKLPLLVWFSVDIDRAEHARALQGPDGALRPNGEAFRKLVKGYSSMR